jgi:hypothetical protein
MTIQELTNMNVETAGLIKNSDAISQSIVAAATEYADTRLAQETGIQQLKAKLQTVNASPESPMDYDKSRVREMPLSADSLTMDMQYFSFNENEQHVSNTIATIRDFIDASTDVLGDAMSNKISTAATSQINRQKENHDITGTLIITASCTHRNAVVISPFVIDIDKAITVWNELFPEGDRVNTNEPAAIRELAKNESSSDKSISLLSGATYGSSFVGMVHVLRKETTKALPQEAVDAIQEQFKVGKWFATESGGFGIDPSFSSDIKNLISSQGITAHVTIITMGVVPSVKSNELRAGVKTLTEVDTVKTANEISVVTDTADDIKTLSSSAARSQSLAEMQSIKSASVQNVMMGLGKIDEAANRVLDVNSMMTAFEDYTGKVNSGRVGVPINYYLKKITRAELAAQWIQKYYPDTGRPATANAEMPSGAAEDPGQTPASDSPA